MKLQNAVDKLFSHKLFSNKYFLYAIVVASILSNYGHIIAGHYEVVGFFILVGIIMMNFSKNIAIVLTMCLLLTQIIMVGKSIREGLTPMDNKDKKKHWSPEEKKLHAELKQINIDLNKASADIVRINSNLTNQKANLDKIKASQKLNREALDKAQTNLKTAPIAQKVTKQRQVDIAKQAVATSAALIGSNNANISKITKHKFNVTQKQSVLTGRKTTIVNRLNILKAERIAKQKAAADAKAKAKADAEAKAKAKADAKSKADAKKKPTENKSIASVFQKKSMGKNPGPFKQKSKFALLSDSDDDMEDDNNGIDFLQPSNITGLTQGTTNLMTKQKDLFSFMNSMTPLIENAKKMLNGMDLTQLQAK